VFFEPFVKKLAGNLYREDIVFKFYWFDWEKPGFVTLIVQVVADYFEIILPNFLVKLFYSFHFGV
jgi:hypothetical protein